MSVNPPTLRELGRYWTAQGGINLGVVGNAAHTWGYHLGRDRIYAIGGKGDRDPSVRLPRDRAGLSNAASAIDLGRLGGSAERLTEFVDWLVARCQSQAPGTDDIREIIWPRSDGVWYYDHHNRRRSQRLPDDSAAARAHRRHAHASFYRDSEARAKVSLFAPFFEEDDMPIITTPTVGHTAILRAGARVRGSPATSGKLLRTETAAATWPAVVGWVTGQAASGSDQWLCRPVGGGWEYVHRIHVERVTAPATADPAAVLAAENRGYNQGLSAVAAAIAAMPRRG